MDLDFPLDAHGSTPIGRPGAEPCADLIERLGVPRVLAPLAQLAGGDITPNAIARAIEDLKRSGYRPLHAPQAAPGPSSIPRARVAPGRDV
jgi:hypothetical protein